MNAKVQFNCADQDFVSYTLLEAAAFNCAPLYPRYLTFPDALQHNNRHLYEKRNLQDAKAKLYELLDASEYGEFKEDYSWVYKPFEGSVERMLRVMGFLGEGGGNV
jgi:hypothetical protein